VQIWDFFGEFVRGFLKTFIGSLGFGIYSLAIG